MHIGTLHRPHVMSGRQWVKETGATWANAILRPHSVTLSSRWFLSFALFGIDARAHLWCHQRPSEVKLYEPRANNLGQVHKVGFLSTRSPSLGDAGWKKRWSNS